MTGSFAEPSARTVRTGSECGRRRYILRTCANVDRLALLRNVAVVLAAAAAIGTWLAPSLYSWA